jgi:FAD/FMN-containing dehydrogenase
LTFELGGISYFGAAHGFGCDLVSNFEIVLANGAISNANARENPGLFTALKGGSNNFGIVTRFDLKTFELGQYFGGSNYYLGNDTPQLVEAFAAFASDPNFDDRAGLLLSILYTSSQGLVTASTFSYTEAIDNPPVFVNFTSAIPPLVSATSVSNLSYFADTLGGANTPGNLR